MRAACRFACAYVLRRWLDGFFQGCTLLHLNEKDFCDGGLQASTMRRKRKRSGKRFAYQAGQRMQSQVSWHPVQCAAVVPTPYQGWVLRAGPPALSGVFLPLFFLRRRRKNGAPGGRLQDRMEKIRIRKATKTPASKLAPAVVSASAAASGLLTRLDDGCSHKFVWYPVQCAAAAPTPYAGVGP